MPSVRKRAKTGRGVKKEKSVLGNDVDHHGQPHKRGDAESGSCDEQRANDSRSGEDRRDEDGERCGEVTEFRKEDPKDKDRRENENPGEFGERLLLFFVDSAIRDPNRFGEMKCVHRGLNACDCEPQVGAFEAAGYTDFALQVFPRISCWPES